MSYDETSDPTLPTQGTAAQMWAWLQHHSTGLPVDEIVGAYWLCGDLAGIDPLLAFAQAAHETSFFTSWWFVANHNPAGIAVNGATSPVSKRGYYFDPNTATYRAGRRYDSAVEGIAAQVGLLGVYCGEISDIAYAARNGKPMKSHPCFGTVTQLRHLGAAHNPSGKGWATPGENYGAKIALIANGILQWQG